MWKMLKNDFSVWEFDKTCMKCSKWFLTKSTVKNTNMQWMQKEYFFWERNSLNTKCNKSDEISQTRSCCACENNLESNSTIIKWENIRKMLKKTFEKSDETSWWPSYNVCAKDFYWKRNSANIKIFHRMQETFEKSDETSKCNVCGECQKKMMLNFEKFITQLVL